MEQIFTLISKADGLALGATLVAPEQPRGIVQISHGMAEHRGRYLEFQRFLAERGWASVIHDHRGHGESVRAPEDYGYFYKRGAENIVLDVHQVTRWARQKFPGLPLVLLGHSMGSLVVRDYLKRFDRDIDGLVVCGSPSRNVFAGVGKHNAGGLRLLQKGHFRSAAIQRLAFGSFAGRFEGTSENRWICSDPAVVAAYDADERCGFVFTANGFYNLFQLMQNCYSQSGWQVGQPELPVFFIAGAEDPCIISPDKFREAVDFLRRRGYREVTGKLYPGLRHEILNERGKEEVYADVLAFADGVAAGAPRPGSPASDR